MNYKTRNRIQTFVIGDPILPGDGGDLGGGTESIVFDVPENYYLEKDKYLENTCGSRNIQRANLRTGKLYVNQFVHGVSGNRLPFNLALTYNPKYKDDTEIFGNQELTNTAGKLPFKGWKFNYQQYVRKQNDKFYYYDADFMLHVFVKCQNSTNVYYDSTGQTGMLLTETIDENGLRIALEITDGKNTKLQFNLLGNLAKIIEKKGTTASEVSIAYDTSNRISSVTDGAGRVFAFSYDTNGNLIALNRTDLEQTQTIAEFTVTNSKLTNLKYVKELKNVVYEYHTDKLLLHKIIDESECEQVDLLYLADDRVRKITSSKIVESALEQKNELTINEDTSVNSKTVTNRIFTEGCILSKNTVYYFAQNGELIFSLPHAYSQDQAVLNKVNTFFTTHTFANAKVFSGCEVILTQDPVFEFKKSGANMQVNASEIKDSDEVSVSLSSPTKALLVAKIVSSNSADDGSVISDLSKVNLVINGNTSHIINFIDSDKILKSTVVSLPAGESVKIKARIMNFSSNSITAEVALYPFAGTEQKEVISENNIDESLDAEVCILAGRVWYEPKKCNIYLNDTAFENVEFTYRDYMLTLISYFKNSTSFTAWYNDGKNAIAGCTLSTLKYLFRTDGSGTQKQLTLFKYGIYQKGINNYLIAFAEKNDSYLITRTEKNLLGSTATTFTKLDSYFRPVTQQDENGIITAYSYDAYGNCTQQKVYHKDSTSNHITSDFTYTSGDQLASEKDYRELSTFTTSYNYDVDGKLIKVTTPKGQVINYTHPEMEGYYATMQTTLNNELIGNRVLTEKRLVSAVDSYNDDITFAYDKFNNVNRVFNNKASFYNVNTVYQNVDGAGYTEITYGTTDKKERRYFDEYGHVTQVKVLENNEWKVKYEFIYSDYELSDDTPIKVSANSKLRKIVDKDSSVVYNCEYDIFGNIKNSNQNDKYYAIIYDALGRLELQRITSNYVTIERNITYKNNFSSDIKSEISRSEITGVEVKTQTDYVKDSLNRPTSTTVKDGANNGYKVTYEYYPKEYQERVTLPPIISPGGTIIPGGFQIVTRTDGTTGYIQTVKTTDIASNVEGAYKKETITYDANGNITNIEAKLYNANDVLQSTSVNSYVYDNLNRLTRENNADLQKSFTYEYDIHGNLTAKKEYTYTTGTLGTPTSVYALDYNPEWSDQLETLTMSLNHSILGNISVNLEQEYDAMGNPTLYKNKNLTWELNRLVKASDDNIDCDIYYDAYGQIKDIDVEEKTDGYTDGKLLNRMYRHGNGQIVYEDALLCEMYYVYNQQGVTGFYLNNKTNINYFANGLYTFRKNIFGDITDIYYGSTRVASYKYDAYGNCTVENFPIAGLVEDFYIGDVNPFRYRGYYWCEALQMYHLQTRWYDPYIGRFISPDSYEYLAPETIGGLNLYTYANNNPINIAYNAFGGMVGVIASNVGCLNSSYHGLISNSSNILGALGALSTSFGFFDQWSGYISSGLDAGLGFFGPDGFGVKGLGKYSDALGKFGKGMAIAGGIISWGNSVYNNFTNPNYTTSEAFGASVIDAAYYGVTGALKYKAGVTLGSFAINAGIAVGASILIGAPEVWGAGLVAGLSIAAGGLVAIGIGLAGAVAIYYIGEGVDWLYGKFKEWIF